MPEPFFYIWMTQNKMITFFAHFLINNFAASLITIGAFEIYYNNNLIYSKLQNGHLPSVDDLMEAFQELSLKK